MKQPIVVCGVVSALMASTALARSHRVDLVFDRTEVMVGETVEATLVATMAGGSGWYFSGLYTDLIASDPSLGLASSMSGLQWAMPPLGPVEAGTPNGASLIGVYGGQNPLFGPVDTSNPFVIGHFTITALSPGELTYSSRRAPLALGSFFITDPSGPWGAPIITYELSPTETITIRSVPGPASVAVLGLMPLVVRRRRSGCCRA